MKKIYLFCALLILASQLHGQSCTPNDFCETAPLLCGFALETQVFNNDVTVNGSLQPNCIPGFVPHNSVWFRVIPCSNQLSLIVQAITSQTGDGLQLALYSDCNSASTIACDDGQASGAGFPLAITATVTPGQEYYLQVDGYIADVCDFTINVLSGVQTTPPPPAFPVVDGLITSIPAGNNFCKLSSVRFRANWPGCAAFTAPQLSCYVPEEDSCKGIKWTLPLGAQVIGDPYANPIQVDFSMVVPGNYTIKARPMDCACPEDLCETCGPICCPVNELLFPITITNPATTFLPVITLCSTDWPPACATQSGGNVSGSTATCVVSSNPALCQTTIQPYLLQTDTTYLGTISICPGDTILVCGTTFTIPGTYNKVCNCDSLVSFTIANNLDCVHDCANYNFPAAPGDDCSDAPFLCGNYLDDYCSSNMGMSSDTLNGSILANSGFLRFSPCDPGVTMLVSVRNCQLGNSLNFWLLTGDCTDPQLSSSVTIPNNQTLFLSYPNLLVDTTYYLVFGGNDVCEFDIQVINGIGTAEPTAVDCTCTNSTIQGPTNLCPTDVAVYTLVPGVCTINITGGGGGGDYFCCPGTDSRDSLKLVWHIPSFMNFLSDSVNVTTITTQVDSSYLGQNVSLTDSVYVTYELVPLPNVGPVDTLVFCDCPAFACSGGGSGLSVSMSHQVENYFCVLTCFSPVCIVQGTAYPFPGIFITQTKCKTKRVQIFGDFTPPTLTLTSPSVLTCTNPTTTLTAITAPNFAVVNWSGPGIPNLSSKTIVVSQPGLYTCIATNPSNGCTSVRTVVVTANFVPPIAVLSPPSTICAGTTKILSAAGSSAGINFSYAWSGGLSGLSVTVSPIVTTTYTLTVTNTINGCTSTATTIVTVTQPVLVNEAVQVVCAPDWPPACPTGLQVNGNTAFCDEPNLSQCQILRHNYQLVPDPFTNLTFVQCPGDTFFYNGSAYTSFNTPYQVVLTSFLGCDSIVQFVLVPDPNCTPPCPSFNLPAAPGDACDAAPFLCGNYLDGYCSANTGLNADTLNGVPLEHSGFIRFSSCEDSVHLSIDVNNCVQNNELRFFLMSGDCTAPVLSAPVVIANNQQGDFVFPLIADSTYFLVFAGTDQCDFQIEVVSGIGTADPVGASCSCTDGYIDGPSDLCPGETAQFNLVLPSCSVTYTPATSGNGYFCCPANEQDSFNLVWHIPSAMKFLSDSINVLTITVQVDSALLGIDTTIMDSVWVSYDLIQNTPADSLTYCECTSCAGKILAKQITINHDVIYDFCSINCFGSTCELNGVTYPGPGTYTTQTNCETLIVVVTGPSGPPQVIAIALGTLTCSTSSAVLQAFTDPSNLVQWIGPGLPPVFGNPITVNQPGNYTCIVTDPLGCTNSTSVDVLQDSNVPIAISGPNATICVGASAVISSSGSSTGPEFVYSWSTGAATPTITVTPLVTTTYILTVTNTNSGCTQTASASITVTPFQVIQNGVVGQINCGECFTYLGVSYCQPGQYADTSACAITNFEIERVKEVLQLGVVGQINCGECFTYLGVSYCQPGQYADTSACAITNFEIERVKEVLQLGVVGQINCGECFTYLGSSYCQPGQYADTSACAITNFEIQFLKDTLQLGLIGTLTCAQPCITFLNQNYCAPGTYTVTDSCTVSIFSIDQNVAPPAFTTPVETCLPGNNSYSVGFTINGLPPYKVNGTPINGSYYLSEPVPSSTPYTFIIEQTINGCQQIVSGVFDCNFAMCTGSPGNMDPVSLQICGSGSVAALILNPPVVSTGTIAAFILHTLPDTIVGLVLGQNQVGTFSFDPLTMNYGVLYYVSSIIGPADANGQILVSDICTKIAPGQPVVFHALPAFGGILKEDPSCFGISDGVVACPNAAGAEPLLFALNNGSFGTSSLFENLPSGSYTLSLKDQNGCTADTMVFLQAADSLWLYLGPDREVRKGQKVLLTATTNADAVPEWTNESTQEQHQGLEWNVAPIETVRYTCTVEGADGCSATASIQLRVLPEGLYHPNVIDPQGTDLANQNFTIFAAEGYATQIISLNIFDRWGDRVFEARNTALNAPEQGWNGTVRNRKAQPGVYAFIAQVQLYDGTVKQIVGDVTVIR